MIELTKLSFRKLTIFSLFAAVFCFVSGESLAQSERDKLEIENAKSSDRANSDQSVVIKDNSSTTNATHSVSTLPKEKAQPSKKESNTSGEGKKIETVPSTLSFNIFLYIVDKFKAD